VKRDPFIYIGGAVAAFLVVLLALSKPEAALIPTAILGGVLCVALARSDRRPNKARPCQVCGRRFRGADMVEHHVNEHRVCDS